MEIDCVVGDSRTAVGIGYSNIVPTFTEGSSRLCGLCVAAPQVFVIGSATCLELGAARSRNRGRTVIAVTRLFRLCSYGCRQSGRHLHVDHDGIGLAAGILHRDGIRQRLGHIRDGDRCALNRRLGHHESAVSGTVVGSGRTHNLTQVRIAITTMPVIRCIGFRNEACIEHGDVVVHHREAVRGRHGTGLAVRYRHIGRVGVATVVGAVLRNGGTLQSGIGEGFPAAPSIGVTAVTAVGRSTHRIAALVRTTGVRSRNRNRGSHLGRLLDSKCHHFRVTQGICNRDGVVAFCQGIMFRRDTVHRRASRCVDDKGVFCVVLLTTARHSDGGRTVGMVTTVCTITGHQCRGISDRQFRIDVQTTVENGEGNLVVIIIVVMEICGSQCHGIETGVPTLCNGVT